jgi:PAS domain-containing protein
MMDGRTSPALAIGQAVVVSQLVHPALAASGSLGAGCPSQARAQNATMPSATCNGLAALSHTGSADPADFQLALDAMRDGVALWSQDGRLLVRNTAAADLMAIPRDLVRPGVSRLEVMTFLAKRGDYGPTDEPAVLARKLSDGFGRGEVRSLTRRLPDGRYLRADARRLADGRSLVTYCEVSGPADGDTMAVETAGAR